MWVVSTAEPPDEPGVPASQPVAGSFDPDWVASAARQQDPGLPPETADLLAGQAWARLHEIGELDAPALARSLLAANPGVGATPCNAVATAAVAFCQTYGLTP